MNKQTQLTEQEAEQLKNRLVAMQIHEIADLIYRTWGHANIYFGAKPYLDAMMSLSSINDDYGLDSGKSIVIYFLSNAQSWRGPVAKLVKAELNRRYKAK